MLPYAIILVSRKLEINQKKSNKTSVLLNYVMKHIGYIPYYMVSGKAALQPVINITKPLPAQVISVWSQARRRSRSRNGHCRLPGDKEQISTSDLLHWH